ncbi:MAG TPA: hypothetical protein VGD58_04500 [Herpetosiphonaceae bacterium]
MTSFFLSRYITQQSRSTRWAFDYLLNDEPLESLIAGDFGWREGWEYWLP